MGSIGIGFAGGLGVLVLALGFGIKPGVVFFSGELEKLGVDYIELLSISIPSTFIACMLGAIVTNFLGKDLKDDPVYHERVAKGLVSQTQGQLEARKMRPGAKLSVLIL
jgi:anaerobic C4-dicarboxylate transporter DcuA